MATTPFWQPNSLVKTTQDLLRHYFGENPSSFKPSLVVAEVINAAKELENKKEGLEKEVWLYKAINKILTPKIDPQHELISGKLGTLSKDQEGLVDLLLDANDLSLQLNRENTQAKEDEIMQRAGPAPAAK